MGDTKIQMESKSNKRQKSEFTMRVGKHEAKVRFCVFCFFVADIIACCYAQRFMTGSFSSICLPHSCIVNIDQLPTFIQSVRRRLFSQVSGKPTELDSSCYISI